MRETQEREILQRLAELSRLGPEQGSMHALVATRSDALGRPATESERTYELVLNVLHDSLYGYKLDSERQNAGWIGFTRGDAQTVQTAWERLENAEYTAINNTTEVPLEDRNIMYHCYKVCVALPPNQIAPSLRLLAYTLGDAPLVGKVAKVSNLSDANLPQVVLYIKGSSISEVLDFVIALSHVTRHILGESGRKIADAKNIDPGSGVFLTQGTYRAKQIARRKGTLPVYYGEDGALFAANESRYAQYLARRENQRMIEESWFNYTGITASEKLIALQQDAFALAPGVQPSGVRYQEVVINDPESPYYPPKALMVPKLLEQADQRLNRLTGAESFNSDYDYALRTAAVAYTIFIMIHPFLDGNGQACMNLISSLLYDGGHRRIYFRAFMGAHVIKAKALGLTHTIEMPEIPIRERDTAVLDRAGKRLEKTVETKGAKVAQRLIEAVLADSGWVDITYYVQTGDFQSAQGFAWSLVTRAHEVYNQLLKTLSDRPTGDVAQSFADLKIVQEKGMAMGDIEV
ncbi:hypothetical protein A3D08_00735 [Candidatus Roizmanbacteria bacterium RIFCSPHIGHO2_02_FULL_43_11]|uniref:Fido domain-containing protein n=1 Tax=Candidatus Roizmanbacteria bacterium RIFCSPHIGHO2_02_FULL_43_11 TaxID=1802043 RepID=A0A1F7HF15_9BACT|nr:MAG: hypothetical protein A3D08_00735 [Candidatus Roizmanbacteria bacterium RIFCSPHIGHO2_02_FULL_43_11]